MDVESLFFQRLHAVAAFVADKFSNHFACCVWLVSGHTLDKITEMLLMRGLPLPPSLIIQADNTCRENRNQYLCLWASHLVSAKVFKSVSFAYFRTGHTHNQVDQKFQQVSHHLQAVKVIETPKEKFCSTSWFLVC